MKYSFLTKIVGLVIMIVLVVSVAIFGITYYFTSRDSNEQSKREVSICSEAVKGTLESQKEKVKMVASFIASIPDVAIAIEKKDTAFLQRLCKDIVGLSGLGVITISDKAGNVVARGHSQKTGDNVYNQINVKKALAGEESVGIEEGTVVKLSLRAGCPVKINRKIVGCITTGVDLSSDNSFVDDIKKKFAVECTIFHKDTRVSTTIIKGGRRAIGTRMDNPEVIETVLNKGQIFLKRNRILGVDYDTIYWPIVFADGKIGGMFFIGKNRDQINKAFMRIIGSMVGAILLLGPLMITAGFIIARSMTRPINRVIEGLNVSANQVASASSLLSSASQSLAKGASEQATSVEETSSSLEEMASMTMQNADNSKQANNLVAETTRVVKEANRAMVELTNSMQEISTASQETAKIIKTIDEIAFQTNLLALNAAVEAARAGDVGAGFAIVASEVRNLAMRVAAAAKNTASLIEGTLDKIKNGSDIVSKTNETFGKVATSSIKVEDLVGDITAASQEQAQGVEQINKAVTEVDKVVQQIAASAEESASASEEMNGQAEIMKSFVIELVSLVKGGNGYDAVYRNSPGSVAANSGGASSINDANLKHESSMSEFSI